MARKQARRRHRAAKRQQQKAARARNLGQERSYQGGLIAAIRLWFPCQFFAQWRLMAGLTWTPQRLFWVGILMSWSVEQTLGDRFEAVRDLLHRLFPKWSVGKSYTGWCDAQAKWLLPLKPAVTKRMQKHMQQQAGKYWTRAGWCAFAADGSRVECPRTALNEQMLGCAGRNKTGPQLFLTTLWHMGTGLPWDFRIGPGTDSERRHLEDMLAGLPPNALLVADAGFTGYDFYQRISDAGHKFLMRVGANVHLLRELGVVDEQHHTVYLWPDERRSQPPLVLRLIVRQRGTQKMYLVTNVLDQRALSEQTAAFFYEMRWGVELFYRSTKQTLQKRKMLSHTPVAAQCELTWGIFGIWLLGLMSVSGLIAQERDPLQWSVAAARSTVRQHMRRALTDGKATQSLSEELSQALQDDYQRHSCKKARNWPHKKKEKPPGSPDIRLPTAQERRAAQRFKEKNPAA
jgi:Transposase DDE domain